MAAMAVVPRNPVDRLVTETDLDRAEFVRAGPRMAPFGYVLTGGPCAGHTGEASVLPDLFRLEAPEGRYLPTFATTEPKEYVWVAGPDH